MLALALRLAMGLSDGPASILDCYGEGGGCIVDQCDEGIAVVVRADGSTFMIPDTDRDWVREGAVIGRLAPPPPRRLVD